MREFNPIKLGERSEIPTQKKMQYGDFETARTFSYPRSYNLSIEQILSEIYRTDLEFPPKGSEEGFYKWIEAAFDTAHISKSGEIHAQDFDSESKSIRELTTVRAHLNRPTRSDNNTNELWETGSHVTKK